jgi:hypothetical protein
MEDTSNMVKKAFTTGDEIDAAVGFGNEGAKTASCFPPFFVVGYADDDKAEADAIVDMRFNKEKADG